ncbi:MAG: hypothetical protein EPN91_00490 [Salinibacterium sp.]|nr:MAG: hypothetical protein EPN91_00490 [Salinibacterium sp.]
MPRYHLKRNADGHLFCTDGSWQPPDQVGFVFGKIPRRYASAAGVAAKQRACDFGTTPIETD